MRKLVLTPRFRRAYRRFIGKDRKLKEQIEAVLRHMQEEVFAAHLRTHKLSGELFGLWACSCGYDCRIIFALEVEAETGDEVLILLNIGTHDEVY